MAGDAICDVSVNGFDHTETGERMEGDGMVKAGGEGSIGRDFLDARAQVGPRGEVDFWRVAEEEGVKEGETDVCLAEFFVDEEEDFLWSDHFGGRGRSTLAKIIYLDNCRLRRGSTKRFGLFSDPRKIWCKQAIWQLHGRICCPFSHFIVLIEMFLKA